VISGWYAWVVRYNPGVVPVRMATKGAGNLVDSRMSFVMRLMSVLSERKGRCLRAELSHRAASSGLVACPMWLYLIPCVESPCGKPRRHDASFVDSQ
jgi:hypothetical protein